VRSIFGPPFFVEFLERVHVDWDIMFCSDELGALNGFLKSHIENTVSREQGIIKLFVGKRLHLLGFRCIAGAIKRNVIDLPTGKWY
jgi:hypothetical protein